MRERRWLYPALGALIAIAAIAATAAVGGEMVLRNDGLRFPDGSVQTTAWGAGTPVQGSVTATIPDLAFCSPLTLLYAVPVDERLTLHWISAEIASAVAQDPVDFDVKSGSVYHAAARLTGAVRVGASPFVTQRAAAPLRIHGAPGDLVEFRACRDAEVGELYATLTYTGSLAPVP